MGINSAGGSQGSPIDRLASLLGVVKVGKDTYDTFRDDSRKQKEIEDSRDAASPLSVSARKIYGSSGLQVPDTASAHELSQQYGPVAEYAKERRHAADEIALKQAGEGKNLNLTADQLMDNIGKGGKIVPAGTRGATDVMAPVGGKMQLIGLVPPRPKKDEAFKLPASEAQQLGGANSAVGQLKELGGIMGGAEDISGPFQGMLTGAASKFQLGDRGKRGASLDTAVRSTAQSIGTYLEKGKLTDADYERKYVPMLPNVSDSPVVRANKIQYLEGLIAQRQSEDAAALSGAGYDLGSIKIQQKGPPISVAKKDTGGVIPSAMADEIKDVGGVKYRKVEGGWARLK